MSLTQMSSAIESSSIGTSNDVEETVPQTTEEHRKPKERLVGPALIENIIESKGAYFCPFCRIPTHGPSFCERLANIANQQSGILFVYILIQQYVYKCCKKGRIATFNLPELCRMLSNKTNGPRARNWSLHVVEGTTVTTVAKYGFDKYDSVCNATVPGGYLGCKIVYGRKIYWFSVPLPKEPPVWEGGAITCLNDLEAPISFAERYFKSVRIQEFDSEREYVDVVELGKPEHLYDRDRSHGHGHAQARGKTPQNGQFSSTTPPPPPPPPRHDQKNASVDALVKECRTILMTTPDSELRIKIATLLEKHSS